MNIELSVSETLESWNYLDFKASLVDSETGTYVFDNAMYILIEAVAILSVSLFLSLSVSLSLPISVCIYVSLSLTTKNRFPS